MSIGGRRVGPFGIVWESGLATFVDIGEVEQDGGYAAKGVVVGAVLLAIGVAEDLCVVDGRE